MSKVDILALSKEAELKKLKDPSITNAIIGMYLNEDSQLGFETVKNAITKLDPSDLLPYGVVSGGLRFSEDVLSWVFGAELTKITNRFYPQVIATPGGSGAVYLSFGAFGKQKTKVIVPKIRWRYDYFAAATNKLIVEYDMFSSSGSFSHNNLKNIINSTDDEEVVVVINDPCHNPTGYCMSKLELDELIKLLNNTKKRITVLYDIAYQDYHPDGMFEAHKRLGQLADLKNHVTVVVAFSGSKTFGIYGLRMGAAIILHPTKKDYDNKFLEINEQALGTWSTAPSIGISLFKEIKDNFYNDFLEELTGASKTLKLRGQLFIKEAKEVGLAHYTYHGGFFVLIKSDNPDLDSEKLKKKGVYATPLSSGIRISLSSVKLSEIMGLAMKINNTVSS